MGIRSKYTPEKGDDKVNGSKQILTLALAGGLLAGCQPGDQNGDTSSKANLDSLEAKVNYSLGYNYASQLQQNGVDLNAEAFAAGFADSAEGSEGQLTQEEMQSAFQDYQASMQEKASAEQDASASENATAAKEFLAENAQAEGVQVTDSGLQYKVLEEGDGPKPGENSTVRVHYEGSLLDGTVFDSSYERGEPVEFGVTQVIPGWTEALQMMPEGSKWELYIPPELGYGSSGAGGLIGPNELLTFEVELLKADVADEESEAESSSESDG